jgi:pyruvate,water dikinase
MGLAAFRLLASSAAQLMSVEVKDPVAGPPAYAEAGQRVFIDATGSLHGRVGRAVLPRWLDLMEARTAAILRPLTEDPRVPMTRPSRLAFIRRAMRVAIRFAVPWQILRGLVRPEATLARIARIGAELPARFTPSVTATASERIDFIISMLGSNVLPLLLKTMPPTLAGFGMFALAKRLLGQDAAADELETMLRGLPNNVTTEMDLELWRVACKIRKDQSAAQLMRNQTADELCGRFKQKALPDILQREITAFLSKYGHRAVAEIDIGMPRWSDDPAHILGVLANYLRLEDDKMSPDAIFARGVEDAKKTIENLVGRVQSRGRIRAALVRFTLNRTRQLGGLREIPKSYVIVAFAAVRRELQRIGAELAQKGTIETADDIFFLNFTEARAAIAGQDLKALVAQFKQEYGLELRRRYVPSVVLSDGTKPETSMMSAIHTDGLTGTPASAGSITGIARVIMEPVGAHLEPGEILVAPSTDPGWTPLFLTAGGLVMEMGGANSHGAVVARNTAFRLWWGFTMPLVESSPGRRLLSMAPVVK